MQKNKFPIKKNKQIIALGAESAGFFAVYCNGCIVVSENFGDLLDENNFVKYKKAVLGFLKKEKINPCVILTDLHPLFKTTLFGRELAKKYRIPHIKIQHHIAHIFSSIGDKIILDIENQMPDILFGVAMDGTGYGFDEEVWGGEVFKIKSKKSKAKILGQNPNVSNLLSVERIGSLEEQIMIGGDLAVREPARMIISILSKILPKEGVYKYIKKYYSKNEFEALYNQMKQEFNCQKSTSTGRILDAVSILLGFAGNERNFKHEATKSLEKNSTKSYKDLEPRILNYESRKILDTTYLFEYLIKNIKRDKMRLAATAQLYIAKGLYEIVRSNNSQANIFAAGGMTNNKIIAGYLKDQNVCLSKKIPRGDEGIAVGQIVYYLVNKK